MQRIIAEAEEAFDWVVLDTPPISLITDARLLAAMVHAAVLVVRAGSTPCALIQQAIETLDRSRVIGVVLNCVEERSVLPGGKYGKYYSSYYDRPANARVDVQPQASTRL
jgi:Mrp family chromosome partitioning ATPase